MICRDSDDFASIGLPVGMASHASNTMPRERLPSGKGSARGFSSQRLRSSSLLPRPTVNRDVPSMPYSEKGASLPNLQAPAVSRRNRHSGWQLELEHHDHHRHDYTGFCDAVVNVCAMCRDRAVVFVANGDDSQ